MCAAIEIRESGAIEGPDYGTAESIGIEQPNRISLRQAMLLVPRKPGAYRFWDANDHVLYVGKAKNLHNRIASHITQPNETARHQLIIERASTIDWIVTPNEVEALLLEDALIKRHKPLFNVRFRDDKRYPILRLDIADPFPTLTVVRRAVRDGALYFGPYTSSKIMRTILRVIERYFPLRRCIGNPIERSRECLNYQIRKCSGVCQGHIDAATYAETVRQVQLLLSGRNDELLHTLESEMRTFSEKLNYEAAAMKRDQLKAIRNISGGRRLLLPRPIDIDVFAFTCSQTTGYAEILLVRAGMVSGNVHLFLDLDEPLPEADLADYFLTHYYNNGAPVPRIILCSHTPRSGGILEDLLLQLAGRKVFIRHPVKGVHASLIRLASSNLKLQTQSDRKVRAAIEGPLAVQRLLRLPEVPLRIEAIDISESQGKYAVGSVVSFENGVPQRNRYRRYRIQSGDAVSDVDRIREVMLRRLKRKNLPEWSLPDIFLIDGGKAQHGAASCVAESAGLTIPIIALVKARNKRTREGIFLPDGSEQQPEPEDPALRYLDQIRDEAHRFAITYHRELRERSLLRSVIMEAPGIGPQRRKILLDRFGSLEAIRQATVEKIAELPGFGKTIANHVVDFIQRTERERKNRDENRSAPVKTGNE
ncbi:excinuclease ABC subunit UvrC [bacterium]|nr:excinuclease ABC subunit UvrC [candidate division CSSED10-310 bacterium]